MRVIALGSTILLTIMISGCGQKGPLYMPDYQEPAEVQEPPAETEPTESGTSPEDLELSAQ